MCADPSTIHESSSDDGLDVLLANNKGGDESISSSEESHEKVLLSLANNNKNVDKNAGLKPVVDGYQSPSMVTQKTILMVGFAIYLVSYVWPPLILVVTYMASIFIPYAYRINDDASTRRKLIHQFEQEDPLAAVVRQLPDDVSFEESYWPTDRGVLLHTAVMAPTQQKVKAVACFCHGYGDNVCYTKRKELARLVQNGIAVVMIDYEGFGKSDGTLGLVKDWNVMVNDVCTYFQHVSRTQFPGQKMFLIGESMGGAVVYNAYKRMSDMVSGVVFLCPMCKLSDDMVPPQWIVNFATAVAGPTGTTGCLGYFPITPSKGDLKRLSYRLSEKRAIFTRVPSVFGRNARLATAREIMNVTRDISSSLSEFDAPFLVQHGKEDRVTDPKLSQALYNESKSKDKTIKLYDGMWHSLLNGEPTENIDLVMQDTISWILERAE